MNAPIVPAAPPAVCDNPAALAAPGAALGGFLARPIALWLGPLRLKTLDGLWIIGSSVFLLLASR